LPPAGSHRPLWRAEERKHELPPEQRGYDADWRRLRAEHLAEEPYCRECAKVGVERLATIVDHIETIRLAPERRLDPTNLQSLCFPHHNQKINQRDGGFGHRRR
jgi:5-methylcytosine-specific restriction enzyme A